MCIIVGSIICPRRFSSNRKFCFVNRPKYQVIGAKWLVKRLKNGRNWAAGWRYPTALEQKAKSELPTAGCFGVVITGSWVLGIVAWIGTNVWRFRLTSDSSSIGMADKMGGPKVFCGGNLDCAGWAAALLGGPNFFAFCKVIRKSYFFLFTATSSETETLSGKNLRPLTSFLTICVESLILASYLGRRWTFARCHKRYLRLQRPKFDDNSLTKRSPILWRPTRRNSWFWVISLHTPNRS